MLTNKISFERKNVERKYHLRKSQFHQSSVDFDIGLIYLPFRLSKIKPDSGEEFLFIEDDLKERYQLIERFNGTIEDSVTKLKDSLSDKMRLHFTQELLETITHREYHSPISWFYAENYERNIHLGLLDGWRKRRSIIDKMNAEYLLLHYHTYPIKLGTLTARHWYCSYIDRRKSKKI